jgi:hypothetical protein
MIWRVRTIFACAAPALILASVSMAQTAATPLPASGGTIQMAPYEVIDQKPDTGCHQTYETLNHAFDDPFPELRSGPLIEAILWRHRYLADHPGEDAIIITTQDGQRIKSATTIYSRDGKIYASSNALGENRHLKGYVPADLHKPEAVERIKALIQAVRDHYLPGGEVTRGDLAGVADPDNADLGGGLPTLGKALIIAEEQGDYSSLALLAGGQTRSGRASSHAALVDGMIQMFNEPSSEVLPWTYQALHDPNRAGIVPVSFAKVEIPTTDGKGDSFDALVFDWEGMHYIYEPDRGNLGKPIPKNPVTGRPYLCVENGGFLEDVYFCATYLKDNPAEKAVILPGNPPAAAFTAHGTVAIFGLALGPFGLPRQFGPGVIANVKGLAQLRDRLAVQLTQVRRDPARAAKLVPIPGELLGDSAEMQMRRAYLAFQDAGIRTTINEGADASLEFGWQGASYRYGSDRQVHPISR